MKAKRRKNKRMRTKVNSSDPFEKGSHGTFEGPNSAFI
jgi:hypothetical protein